MPVIATVYRCLPNQDLTPVLQLWRTGVLFGPYLLHHSVNLRSQRGLCIYTERLRPSYDREQFSPDVSARIERVGIRIRPDCDTSTLRPRQRFLSTHQCRKRGGNPVQHRGCARRGRPFGSFLILERHVLLVHSGHIKLDGGLCRKHVRVTTAQLRCQARCNIAQVKGVTLRSEPSVQHHLKQKIPQLIAQRSRVVSFRGLSDLVAFLDRVPGQAGVRLFGVPRTTAGRTKAINHRDGIGYRSNPTGVIFR